MLPARGSTGQGGCYVAISCGKHTQCPRDVFPAALIPAEVCSAFPNELSSGGSLLAPSILEEILHVLLSVLGRDCSYGKKMAF